MITFNEIQDVHLEISTLCNSSCAWCPRNFWGYPFNDGYPELNLTLVNAKKIFSQDFLLQLKTIRINGNFGDIVMNLEGPDIVEYFASSNQQLRVSVSTNGAARPAEFWERLACTGATVEFCIDGLEDTHHLYRQNTVWKTVINNAKTVIAAGGSAVWKMICFDHNKHQIDQCRQMSQDLGFCDFQLIDDGRNTAPVFNNKGKLTHTLGNYRAETNFDKLFFKRKTDLVLLEDIVLDRQPKTKVTCETKQYKSIYIAANGDVYPCCFLGFYPKTFGHGTYHQAVNSQIASLISKNNALEHDLEDCINWFSCVQESWAQSKYENGRLVACDDNCGC